MILFKNIQNRIIDEIQSAKSSIKIAVTWFTNNEIFYQVLKSLKEKDLHIELVVLNDQINNKIEGNDFQKFIDLGGKFYFSNIRELVHHKFCIIDEQRILTGSYNWTYYAEKRNWENVTIIEDKNAVQSFIQEFKRITDKHKQVERVNKEILYYSSIDSRDYLRNEYELQIEYLLEKGNQINAGQLISKVLKEDSRNTKLKKQRSEILKTLNSKDEFEVSPFEIGLLYEKGYSMAIPAFEKLPFETTRFGYTAVKNQSNTTTEIQKSDGYEKTIFTIDLPKIKQSEKGTKKVIFHFKLERDGKLEVSANELDGDNVIAKHSDYLQNWL
jgi:hypothetical protein